MSRLRSTEIAAFSRSLAILGCAGGIDTLSDRVTRCLRELFHCDLVSFDLIDLSAIQWNTVVIAPTLPNWADAIKILQQHASDHPIVTHAAFHAYPHAIRTSDLLSLRQYRQLGIYHDFFRNHLMRLDRQLGFVTKTSGTLTLGVSVNRRGRDFSLEQRALLELLRPHLTQAYATARAHAELLARIDSERGGVARAIGGGLCEVDAGGRLTWMTAEVERLFTHYFPRVGRKGDGLPSTFLRQLTAAFPRLADTDERQLDTPGVWRISGARGTLRVQLAAALPEGARVFLLVEETKEPTAAELVGRYNLTVREGEVLYWIGQGKSNYEIGIILAMASRTVGKHLERIFTKLDVYNRTAAARMALQ